MKLIKLGVIATLLTGTLFAQTYNLEIPHSSVNFKVKHMMISNVKGSFDKFDGEINYDDKAKKLISLKGMVNVASVNTADKKRDNHLKSADFFNAEKYPTMKFVSTKVVKDTVYANLTINNVTKEVKFKLDDNGLIVDPKGNNRVGLTLETQINREDFGITWNKLLDKGGVVVGREVVITIELQGISSNKMKSKM